MSKNLQNQIVAMQSTRMHDSLKGLAFGQSYAAINASLKLYPFALDPLKLAFVRQLGINACEEAVQVHPHPLHKTIENHLLYEKWRFYANHDSAVMYMKESKFSKLKSMNENFVTLFNHYNGPKDNVRYLEASTKLPENSNIFIHDAIMYMSFSEIHQLFLSPVVKQIFASLVIPPESFFGLDSLYPDFYKYRVRGSRMHYFLEDSTTGSYDQPMRASQWLNTSSFRVDGSDYTITILDSWGPVHSLLITRGASAATVHRFDSPEIALLPTPDNLDLPLSHRLVPLDRMLKASQYVKSVRTLRESDPHANENRVMFRPEYKWVHPAAWDNMVRLVVQVGTIKTEVNYNPYAGVYDRALRILTNLYLHLRPSMLVTVGSATASWFLGRYGIHASLKIGPIRASFTLLSTAYLGYRTYDFFTQHRRSQYRYEQRVAALYENQWHLEIARDLKTESYKPRDFQFPPQTPKKTEIPTIEENFPAKVEIPTITETPVEAVEPADEIEVTTLAPVPNEPKPAAQENVQELSQSTFAQIYPELRIPHGQCLFPAQKRREGETPLPYPGVNCCLFEAVAAILGDTELHYYQQLQLILPNAQLNGPQEALNGYSSDHLALIAVINSVRFRVFNANTGDFIMEVGRSSDPDRIVYYSPPCSDRTGHWSNTPTLPSNSLRGGGVSRTAQQLLDFKCEDGSLLPFDTVHHHRVNLKRAAVLNDALVAGTDGIKGSPDFSLGYDAHVGFDTALKHIEPRVVELIHIAGFPGCGKSHPIKTWITRRIKKGPFDFKVLVPTVELHAEWKRDLNLESHPMKARVATWETGLPRPASVIIIDEIYKLPPGYLDLVLAYTPMASLVVVLGDPCQGHYHSLNASSPTEKMLPEVNYLARYLDKYCLWSHRIPQVIARALNVHSTSSEEGSVECGRIRDTSTTLVASHNVAAQRDSFDRKYLTMASSQGLTFRQKISIEIDRNVGAISRGVSLVAVTRSTKGIYFTGHYELLDTQHGNTLLYALSTGRVCDFRGLFAQELANAEIITEPIFSRQNKRLRGGLKILNRRQKNPIDILEDVVLHAPLIFKGDSVLAHPDTTYLPPSRKILHYEGENTLMEKPKFGLPQPIGPVAEPLYVGVDYQVFASTLFNSDKAYLEGEREWQGTISNQFPQDDPKVLYGTSDPALIAPIHDSKHDSTLLPLSIEKRLRFRTGEHYDITQRDEKIGMALFQAWLSMHPGLEDHKFSEEIFQDCVSLNDHSILQKKTRASLVANAYRSAADWACNEANIFTKRQHKINSNSINTEWKACQTIALMHDSVVLSLGPVKKYQRHFFEQARRPNVFYYGGHTPDELCRYVQSRFQNSASVANDYTAFDQSQTGEAVVFERLKMELLGIPQDLIDLHVYIKTHINTPLGPLTCMRLTGEPGTYDDNTDYNLAVLALLFNITTETVLVSGDDSCINPLPPIRASWMEFKDNLELRFKIEVVERPLFCGYFLGPLGAVRAPDALFVKLILSETQKTLHKTLDSYIMEFALGHSLGNDLWEVLPEEQWPYQDALFDFFCRKANPAQKAVLRLMPYEINGVFYQAHLTKLRNIKRHLLNADQLETQRLADLKRAQLLL